MERAKTNFKTIEEYHSAAPAHTKGLLEELHRIIRRAAPNAEEVISYNMPAFKQNVILVYYAAYQNHIGFYPTPGPIKAFKEKLSDYTTSKATVQFPLGKPIPARLVQDIVLFRIQETEAKAAAKRKAK